MYGLATACVTGMTLQTSVMLGISALLTIYLVWALLRPEDF